MAETVNTTVDLNVRGLDETIRRVERLRQDLRESRQPDQRGGTEPDVTGQPAQNLRTPRRLRRFGGDVLGQAIRTAGVIGGLAAGAAALRALAEPVAGIVLERIRNPDRTVANILRDAVQAPVREFLDSNLGRLIREEVRRQNLRRESRERAQLQRRDLDARLSDDPQVRIEARKALVRQQRRLEAERRRRDRDRTAARVARGF